MAYRVSYAGRRLHPAGELIDDRQRVNCAASIIWKTGAIMQKDCWKMRNND